MKFTILAIAMAFLATVSFGAQAAVKHPAKHHVVKHVAKK